MKKIKKVVSCKDTTNQQQHSSSHHFEWQVWVATILIIALIIFLYKYTNGSLKWGFMNNLFNFVLGEQFQKNVEGLTKVIALPVGVYGVFKYFKKSSSKTID